MDLLEIKKRLKSCILINASAITVFNFFAFLSEQFWKEENVFCLRSNYWSKTTALLSTNHSKTARFWKIVIILRIVLFYYYLFLYILFVLFCTIRHFVFEQGMYWYYDLTLPCKNPFSKHFRVWCYFRYVSSERGFSLKGGPGQKWNMQFF